MKAVLLAAGKGQRLRPHTDNIPKALVKIRNRELISYSLDFVKSYVDEIIVIGGYKFDSLLEYISSFDSSISLVRNDDFNLGSIFTVEKAFNLLDDSFLVMNIDHIYPMHFAEKIFSYDSSDLIACCDFDRNLLNDDMKVKINDSILYSISKNLVNFDGGYIGMTFIGYEYLDDYKKATYQLIKLNNKNANIESILAFLIKKKIKISIHDFSGYKWFEIDNVSDLEYVNSLASLK